MSAYVFMFIRVVRRFINTYAATDLLLEELALNTGGSESVSENKSADPAAGEVKTNPKNTNLHCTITISTMSFSVVVTLEIYCRLTKLKSAIRNFV